MRVLGASVLAMEVIVILLAGVMATSGDPRTNLAPFIAGIVIAVLIALGAGTVTRPWGVRFGWALQVLALAYGLALALLVSAVYGVTLLVVLGFFVGMWAVAIRTGRRVDALRSEAQAASDA